MPVENTERMCPCDCGKTWQQAVCETMRTCSLNFDQAEDMMVRALAMREEGLARL